MVLRTYGSVGNGISWVLPLLLVKRHQPMQSAGLETFNCAMQEISCIVKASAASALLRYSDFVVSVCACTEPRRDRQHYVGCLRFHIGA
jgi:hypothetical protein